MRGTQFGGVGGAGDSRANKRNGPPDGVKTPEVLPPTRGLQSLHQQRGSYDVIVSALQRLVHTGKKKQTENTSCICLSETERERR